MEVHVNQVGYETTRPKRAVLQAPADADVGEAAVVDRDRGTVVYRATPERAGRVANWSDHLYWTVDLSGVAGTGRFDVCVDVDGETVRSEPFAIEDHLLQERLLNDVCWYVKTQRCSGVYEVADRSVPFVGDRKDTVDVRGGWYDASADVSKYLSHLNYTNYMTPQQIPLVVWALLSGRDSLAATDTGLADELGHRIREEARHGADFLVRAQDEAGYFYTTIFDGWSHDPVRREICAFEGVEGVKTDAYRAGVREGGGMAVAALARASGLEEGGEFGTATYRSTAIEGYDHLRQHNETYLDDGAENLLDDYCGLLAATELAEATGEARFREAATERARSLIARQTGDDRYEGWFRADADDGGTDESGEDADGARPFFHATDEGLPVVALHRYVTALDDPALADDVAAAIADFWRFVVAITDDVTNPYGYPRQYVLATDEAERRPAFFMPHENETGYWWLGENARIASLATAAFRSRALVADSELEARLTDLGHDVVDWILGRNPYGVCMLHGAGTPEPEYHRKHRNAPGGIINGITAAPEDPEGIAFCPEPHASDLAERWRWAEQWLPHAAWFFLALSSTERI